MLNFLLPFSLFLIHTVGQLTFQSPSFSPLMQYNLQTVKNGVRLSTNMKGWTASDVISSTTATNFFVTVESLSGAVAGVGIMETSDQICSPLYFPDVWIGRGSLNNLCWSDFLTLYSSVPSGSTTTITTKTLTTGDVYQFVLTPTSTSTSCYALTITGIIFLFRF